MQIYPHTWDGRPLTANATNWNSFTTNDTPEVSPPVAVTVGSVLAQIHSIRKVLSQPKLDKALRDFYNHVADTNNPHKTDLSQFHEQIVDVLYKAYLEAGGTGSLDFYLQSLFYTLRVATIDEMENATDENLLVSILGANRIIAKHENDENAHINLFQQWFPGEPITADPILVLMGTFGVLPNYLYTKNPDFNPDDTTAFSDDQIIAGNMEDTVGDYIHIDNTGLLVRDRISNGIDGDWGLQQPLLPCFGDHTNLFTNSNIITDDHFTRVNVGYKENTSVAAPDNSTPVTEVYSTNDDEAVEHNIQIKGFELPVGTTKTISLFVKPEYCRYFAFRFVDMVVTGLEVIAVYDLLNCTATMISNVGRYSAEIHRLANGWCRCCFTLHHHIGQKADLTGTFFNMTLSDILSSFKFQAAGETLGYIWGAQLEPTVSATTYIPTDDECIVERGFYYGIDVENRFDVNNMTLCVQFRNPKYWGDEDIERPIFVIVDNEWKPIWSCRMKNDGSILIERIIHQTVDANISVPIVEYFDKLPATTDTWGQLAISIDSTSIRTLYNNTEGLGLETPTASRAGYRIMLGCDEKAKVFNGYIRQIALYSKSATMEELKFLTGEIIHE